MTTYSIQTELARIGRKMSYWQAEVRGLLWLAGTLGCLWLFALSDIWLRYGSGGRIATWAVLLVALAGGVWHFSRTLHRKRTVQGVAARIEHSFPSLDNHLINYVQFSTRRGAGVMESAYVQRGVDEWSQVKVGVLRDRRAQLKSYGFLLGSVIFLIVTGLVTGDAWLNALLRILNPFSARPPSTLAVIQSVAPRDSAVLKGEPVLLSCKVNGKKGQEVFIDLWPKDDKKSATKIGRLVGGTPTEEYSFRVPKVTAGIVYRFRAGDAISDKYEIRALPPLAFAKLGVTVTPPAYTKFEVRSFDGLSDTIPLPQGACVTVAIQCNRDLAFATLSPPSTNADPIPMTTADKGKTYTGALTVMGQTMTTVSAGDTNRTKAEATLKYELIPDKPPAISVVAPTARVALGPGGVPRIEWEVSDDYGIATVLLEQVTLDPREPDKAPERGDPIQEWKLADTPQLFSTNWSGAGRVFDSKAPLAFRIVAVDTCSVCTNRAVSPVIRFDWNSASNVTEQAKSNAVKTANTLNTLVEMQRDNLEATVKLQGALAVAEPKQWQEVADVQRKIMSIAGLLIADPRKPLGSLAETVRKLYQGPMREAVDVLGRIPSAEVAQKTDLVARGVRTETLILKLLGSVEMSIGKVQQNQLKTGILAALDALVTGQDAVLGTTQKATAAPGELTAALISRQDKLATDTGAFIKNARTEADTQSANDKEFAALLLKVAALVETRKVTAAMLKAAELLEAKQTTGAVPHQTEALTALREAQKTINEYRRETALEKSKEISEALTEATKKLEKLAELQAKTAEAIRESTRQKDASDKKTDMADEELMAAAEEVKKNAEEAVLNIATDLQIFPELPVGNDLVQDVFQVFEEIKQVEGSDKMKATELGLQKEDMYLKMMEAAQKEKGRKDDMEMWLKATPDDVKRNTEDFDKEEMPEVPIVPMPSEMEDIIGDLIKQEEEEAKKSDDSATNQGIADLPMGWDIMEGETVSYAAKGKSGNTPPDHKEQDGRGNAGRQGMSDGEMAAGSGKINQGDDQIEKRMTQDKNQSGQFQEDGNADAKATGGGKQGGFGKDTGMAGSGPRRDSQGKQGSAEGLQAMLKRNAQALYARAELGHVKTGSLDEAIHFMQLAEDALGDRANIKQVREFQKQAVIALKKTQTELGGGAVTEIDLTVTAPSLTDQIAGARDEAPANYRDLVSEYFKSLGAAP